jgi:hypothetical protein
VLAWLLGAAIGPAAIALPVNWAADSLAKAAQRWFRRLRHTDDLSRLVKAATGTSAELTRAEFDAIRSLLEDQKTWTLLGHGTVEDLATGIAACLSPLDGRTAKEANAVALAIARGLIEFAVADLDPGLFQQVLMARLKRMEDNQADALDEAMLDLHASFAGLMSQLKLVLDRLPPGPAQRGDIFLYLRVLIDWLSTDPWPTVPEFSGAALNPAAIERKMTITVASRDRKETFGADELTLRCQRLVILGGPGSGKTWLARRTARRCAEDALRVLIAGGTLDEVELPLYTTCAKLFTAGGNIREAVVSSALDQLGDLGGARITTALREFFSERNAPSLLVIDSLDEAHGSSERLRQASTLPWRVVLTSRRSSWRNQLTINDADESHNVGELQPFRYPADVESFINSWFTGQPERGRQLCSQIEQRPSLQRAATVPLILAFYCIVGSSGPLPEFRRQLYPRVLSRILTGRWRNDDDGEPDLDSCLSTLRSWAWQGASNHPVSGLGMWADDIPTARVRLSEADADAVDHVATPLGPRDIDTGKTRRRFIHRSIREHLVAEHVARLPAHEVPDILLPHLWYDPDWEYAAPAAVAMHPQHDELLRTLICRAAGSTQIPDDLSAIDGTWQVRGFLARIASESGENDWSAEVTSMIGRARIDLARSGRIGELVGTASWSTSNGHVHEALLALLPLRMTYWEVERLLGIMMQLNLSTRDKQQVCVTLLGFLGRATDDTSADGLMRRIVEFAPSAEDKQRVRETLLELLAIPPQRQLPLMGMMGGIGGSFSLPVTNTVGLVRALIKLDPSPEDRLRAGEVLIGLLARSSDSLPGGQDAHAIVLGLLQLAVATEDQRRTRELLLGVLADHTDSGTAVLLAWALTYLNPSAADKQQALAALLRLTDRTESRAVVGLADAVLALDPSGQHQQQMVESLLRALPGQTTSFGIRDVVARLVQLATSAEDKRQVLEALLRALPGQTDYFAIGELVGGMTQFATSAEERRRALEALLEALPGQADDSGTQALVAGVVQFATLAEDHRRAREALLGLLAGRPGGGRAADLLGGVVQLATSAQDKRQVLEVLLGLLAGPLEDRTAVGLAGGAVKLAVSAEDKRQVLAALLGLLARQPGCGGADKVVGGVVQLATSAAEKQQAREALLAALARQTDTEVAEELLAGVGQLDPSPEEWDQARETLLGLLADQDDDETVAGLAELVAELGPSPEDRQQVREALLESLAGQHDGLAAARHVQALFQLDPSAEDKGRALAAALELLATVADYWPAEQVVAQLVQLATSAQDRRRARDVLRAALARQTESGVAEKLVSGLVQLEPTVRDLATSRAWAAPPTVGLLTAARRNSPLSDWLAGLPALTTTSA